MKKDRRLLIFFAITLGWTWCFGFAPVLLGIQETALGNFLFYFGGGAPSVTALFMVFITYTKAEKADYFKRCFSFRYMGGKWFLMTVVFFLSVTVVGLLIAVCILGYNKPGMDYIYAVIRNPLYIPLILLLSLISGPLNEEFGWRGFALDGLLEKYGFWGGSLSLGFMWGIWHLPWYFTPGQAQYMLLQKSLVDGLMFIPSVMLLSIVVSYVYIKTNRSILAGAMVHGLSNLINSQLLSPYDAEVGSVIRYTKMIFCLAVSLYIFMNYNVDRRNRKEKTNENRYFRGRKNSKGVSGHNAKNAGGRSLCCSSKGLGQS